MRFEYNNNLLCESRNMNVPKIDMTATGQRIRLLCAERCIRAEEIKDALNLSSTYIVLRWQRGQSIPDIQHLVGLAALLNVSLDDIICCKEVVA